MKLITRYVTSLILLLAVQTSFAIGKYSYRTVENDSLHAQIATLPNGLTVYMSVNREKPRIQAYIAVRVGGKNDPSQTTGLSHYLEHLMFKGTTHFGTRDYAREEPLLTKIEALYEQYRHTKDATKRTAIYHGIDSISYEASKWAIPNEYDKLMASIGSQRSNAYTTSDLTCYMENIPSNEIENWARIEADRFENMVIRGFHTELEAVYEEKNISLTKDSRKIDEAILSLLFPNHPYGQQTVLGTQEHLKNPSIKLIKEHFKKFYVPNNMAICLSGDFDPDEMMDVLTKYFGELKPNENLPKYKAPTCTALNKVEEKVVYGPEGECVTLGWRTSGANSPEYDKMELISELLYNGNTGIIDRLLQAQKVRKASAYSSDLTDFGMLSCEAYPKEGQTLEQARDLLLEALKDIRDGKFTEADLQAVVTNLKLRQTKLLEENDDRADFFVTAFTQHTAWNEKVQHLNKLSHITKQELVDFAKIWLTDKGYAVVFKRKGEDKNEKKIEKPAITAIVTNRDAVSSFLQSVIDSKVKPIEPKFIDYTKDLTSFTVYKQIPVVYKKNELNERFSLTYVYELGQAQDKWLADAANYLSYLGTPMHTQEQLKRAFYQMACDYSISVGENRTYVTLSGLTEHMPEAMALMEEVLHYAKPDQTIYKNYIEDVIKERANRKLNQDKNFQQLKKYAVYGQQRPGMNFPSTQDFMTSTPENLCKSIRSLCSYTHRVLFYGPATPNEVKEALEVIHFDQGKVGTLKEAPAEKLYTPLVTDKNRVILGQYEAKNSYLGMSENEGINFDTTLEPTRTLYNDYFGGGMNSIVFQEMREARGLAYWAYALQSRPNKANRPYTFESLILTQNDKLKEATTVFDNIINELPQSENAFEIARKNELDALRAQRITREDLLWSYLNMQDLGISYDLRKDIYEKVQTLTLKDVVNYQKKMIKDRPKTYYILGDEKDLNLLFLESLAPIERVSQRTLFGY
ncbi:MAG: insulinase family protein [Bacteroidaceae bacterium]